MQPARTAHGIMHEQSTSSRQQNAPTHEVTVTQSELRRQRSARYTALVESVLRGEGLGHAEAADEAAEDDSSR